jgi:tripartite ATP-independent transporter DctP family solute receptor
MSDKKWVRFLFAGLFVAGLSITASTPFAHAASVTLRLAHTDAPDVYTGKKHANAVMFKSIVEDKTQGEVKIEIYPANQLGGERETIEATQIGTLDLCLTSDGPLVSFYPPSGVLTIPFLFSSYEEAWKVLDGPFGKMLADDMVKREGIRTLGYAQTGFRHFLNSKRMLRSPADLKGLKIRVMQSPLYMTMVESLGANPTPVPWPEVYSAAQQGVVDGMEMPVGSVVMVKLFEVQKYMVLDGHVFSTDFLLMNEKKFQSLSKPVQNVFLEAGYVASTAGRAIEALSSALGVETLRKRGMTVYAPNAQEMSQFRSLSQKPVLTWLRKELGKDESWVDRVLKEVESVRR